jgi:hypothetical protein
MRENVRFISACVLACLQMHETWLTCTPRVEQRILLPAGLACPFHAWSATGLIQSSGIPAKRVRRMVS